LASKLYVIFHGAWAFVDNLNPDDGFIYACAPKITDHVYKAGSWCQEKDIPEGAQLTLTLSPVPQTCTVPCGLSASGDTIWNHGDRMLLFPMQCGLPAGASYVKVRLPRPATIFPEMYYRGLQVRFETAASAVAAPISLVPVFAYTLDAGSVPVLKNEGDGTVFWTAPGDNIITLHFFAAEESDSGNPPQDFKTVAALLGYPQAALLKDSPNARCEQLTDIPDLAGREFEVTTFLFQRTCCPGTAASSEPRGGAGPIGVLNFDLASCAGGGGGS
jgi:hypothetical protein